MKIWKNQVFWKAVLFIGCTPFLACLWMGIDKAINGTFLGSNGLEGFLLGVIAWSYRFWPTYLVGLPLILISDLTLAHLQSK